MGGAPCCIPNASIKDHPERPLTESIRRKFDRVINVVELTVLILIGLVAALAMAQEIRKVFLAGNVSLTDLLIMFLYLEVLATDARYLRLGQLPFAFRSSATNSWIPGPHPGSIECACMRMQYG